MFMNIKLKTFIVDALIFMVLLATCAQCIVLKSRYGYKFQQLNFTLEAERIKLRRYAQICVPSTTFQRQTYKSTSKHFSF